MRDYSRDIGSWEKSSVVEREGSYREKPQGSCDLLIRLKWTQVSPVGDRLEAQTSL